MSEYWVSNKKYFCKYCNIYIADDKPSRTQHESGLKHKGNVERFVRGLYKEGQKRKQDLEEEKREMVRVERAAAAAYAQDVGAGLVKPGSSSDAGPSSKPAGPSKPAPKPSDPYTNYSTAQSLGYVDPDEERRKVEAEMRRNQGVVGAWEVITIQESAPATTEDEVRTTANSDSVPQANEGSAQDQLSRKREAEAVIDDEDTRQFKLRRKKIGAGLGEIYDPGVIPIKLKTKKEEPTEVVPQTDTSGIVPPTSSSTSQASAMPKWSARGWSKPGEEKRPDLQPPAGFLSAEAAPDAHISPKDDNSLESQEPVTTSVSVAQTSQEEAQNTKQETDVKPEPEVENLAAPASGALFRKRKVPSGSRGRRS